MTLQELGISPSAGLRTIDFLLTNEQFEQQVAMIEGAGLRRRFELTLPDEPGKSLAYA